MYILHICTYKKLQLKVLNLIRVLCLNFGHMPYVRDSLNYALNKEFVHYTKAETISKLIIYSQFVQNYFSRAKKLFTGKCTNFGQCVRTLDSVSEL